MLYLTLPDDLGRYDALFVSAHLDDVALSCPATLLEEAQGGRRVLVLTLFTTDDVAGATPTYQERWSEEEHALRALGADGLLGNLPDAPWRSPVYQSFNDIVFARDPADIEPVGRAAELIARVVRRARPTVVYAPLGVGDHVDHRLTHEAARVASADFRSSELAFYEDRPYAFVSEAVRVRLAALGLRGEAPDLAPATVRELTASFFFSFFRARYVQTFLSGARARVMSMARYAAQLKAATREGLVPAHPTVRVFEAGMAQRVAPILDAYPSQLPDILGEPSDYVREARAYAERLGHPGHYVERLWSIPAGRAQGR